MAIVKILFVLLCIAFGTEAALNELSVIDDLRKALMGMSDQLQGTVYQGPKTYIDIIEAYDAFDRTVDELFPPERKQFFNILRSLGLWIRAKSEIEIIDSLYGKFRQMQRDLVDHDAAFQPEQWLQFAEAVLNDPKNSMLLKLVHITDIVVHQRLFYAAYEEVSSQVCDARQSPQQLLYNLYNTVALAEMKGFAMMMFSYNILKLHDKRNYTKEIENTKQDYTQTVAETLKHLKIAMAFASTEMWRCDPDEHIEGITYTELKEVFQGYIVNEVDLNPSSSCRENCGYYKYAKVNGCYGNQFCARQSRCNGKVLNCRYVDSDMWICPSAPNSQKRYDYIKYENGRQLGSQQPSCPRGVTKVDSWWRWLFWHCSYCMCYCDDSTSGSDRYVNLRPVESNLDKNKVITGVRFKKENHVIHIQIQEGVLLPKGMIDPDSVTWKPVENYTIHDNNVNINEDYHMIKWEKRAIDLDDLVPSTDDQLLTGLKFRLIGAHLNLEIRTTPFNFQTGGLKKEKSRWYSNDNTDADGSATGVHERTPRTEVMLDKCDIPTHSRVKTIPDSKTNQYLHFQPSDLDTDAAQSTIPFLDIQSIEPSPPTPISGAGIFHKGRHNNGGFVALKIRTYDFTKHLIAEMPEAPRPVIGLSNEINAV